VALTSPCSLNYHNAPDGDQLIIGSGGHVHRATARRSGSTYHRLDALTGINIADRRALKRNRVVLIHGGFHRILCSRVPLIASPVAELAAISRLSHERNISVFRNVEAGGITSSHGPVAVRQINRNRAAAIVSYTEAIRLIRRSVVLYGARGTPSKDVIRGAAPDTIRVV
jgi:hypothetical protein